MCLADSQLVLDRDDTGAAVISFCIGIAPSSPIPMLFPQSFLTVCLKYSESISQCLKLGDTLQIEMKISLISSRLGNGIEGSMSIPLPGDRKSGRFGNGIEGSMSIPLPGNRKSGRFGNGIGGSREFIQKGISIKRYRADEMLAHADAMNERPSRSLGYHTPEELFEAFLDQVYAA